MEDFIAVMTATWEGMKKGVRWPPDWIDGFIVSAFLLFLALTVRFLCPYFEVHEVRGSLAGTPTSWLYRIVDGALTGFVALWFFSLYFARETWGEILDKSRLEKAKG